MWVALIVTLHDRTMTEGGCTTGGVGAVMLATLTQEALAPWCEATTCALGGKEPKSAVVVEVTGLQLVVPSGH